MSSVTFRVLLAIVGSLLSGVLLPACGPRYIEGPGIGRETRVVKIVVEDLDSKDRSAVAITDRGRIAQVEDLFSTSEWEKADRRLLPSHRVQVFSESGESWTYWVGTFSDPPQFPCYWFCSGFWLAGSDRNAKIDGSTHKVLATSGDMITVNRLLRPRPVPASE
jgi:hypothetical protein